MTNLKLAIIALLITGCATQAMAPRAPRKQRLNAHQRFIKRAANETFERFAEAARTKDHAALEAIFTELHRCEAVFSRRDLGDLSALACSHHNDWAEAVFEDAQLSIKQANQPQ